MRSAERTGRRSQIFLDWMKARGLSLLSYPTGRVRYRSRRTPMSSTRVFSVVVSFVFGLLLVSAHSGVAHADPVKCKATIAKSASQYVQARTKALVKCQGAVVAG